MTHGGISYNLCVVKIIKIKGSLSIVGVKS